MAVTARTSDFEKKTFNLPSSVINDFPELAERLGVASDTDVVRTAIRLLYFLHHNIEAGDSLRICKADGREIDVAMFLR
ncbi:hypothetical protein PB2503_08909 [Parvularcula bermudensis HTCC2503]|uniref:Uncharacterized protein n=1 Tax=Parvularcula bermudensis (strain ATCC BAA-594 / HTCC2503 / KCTC 12087) TaxID=314260 RepID=E0TCE5_PARBH|nr:hypothetical protein [Parvularcula bermudensis]ADM09835.1 hypothetical protein PB2503_08909 [Parvularcula bermudensis HTCC2503]